MAAGGQPTWLEKMTALIGDELPSSDDEELPVPKPIRKGLQPGRSTNARPTLNGRENCWEPRLCEYSRDNGSAFRELPAIKRVLKARERHEAACATPSSLSLTPTVRGLGTAAVAAVAQRKSTASSVSRPAVHSGTRSLGAPGAGLGGGTVRRRAAGGADAAAVDLRAHEPAPRLELNRRALKRSKVAQECPTTTESGTPTIVIRRCEHPTDSGAGVLGEATPEGTVSPRFSSSPPARPSGLSNGSGLDAIMEEYETSPLPPPPVPDSPLLEGRVGLGPLLPAGDPDERSPEGGAKVCAAAARPEPAARLVALRVNPKRDDAPLGARVPCLVPEGVPGPRARKGAGAVYTSICPGPFASVMDAMPPLPPVVSLESRPAWRTSPCRGRVSRT